MLDASYKNRENAIEEVVYDFLKDCDPVIMPKDTAKDFMLIGMMPKDVKLEQYEKPNILQDIEKKVEHYFTFQITDERVLLILSAWTESIGKAMLYLWYIQAWCFKNHIKEVDFETLETKIFPKGIFSEKDLENVWLNQKVQHSESESDNLVDYDASGLSIQFIN